MLTVKYDVWTGDMDLCRVVENEADRQLGSVVIPWLKMNADEIAVVQQRLTQDDAETLLLFGKRAAALAIQANRPEYLVAGLAAVAILDSERTDFRDILWSLAVLNHAGERVGVDLKHLVNSVSCLCRPQTAKLFRDFFARPADQKDLRTPWGYDEVCTERGSGFIGWGLLGRGRFIPTYDFKRLIVDVADVVAQDRYQPTTASVAASVPAVWFRGVISKMPLMTVRAAGNIHASLRPEWYAEHDQQKLMVFVMESFSALGSASIASLVDKSKCVALTVRHRELLAIVIARSVVFGVAEYETPQSLLRLRPLIKAALSDARKLPK